MIRKLFSLRNALFAALPAAAFLAASAYLALTNGEARDAPQPPPAQAAQAQDAKLDDHLRDDMLWALNPEPVTIPQALYNPFVDRAGAAGGGRAASVPAGFDPRTQKAGPLPGAPGAQAPPPPPFEERFRAWQRRGRELREQGKPVPPRTSIYSITELEAHGTTRRPGDRTDRGITGAWLFIKPEGQSFTAPLGTVFLDGRLERVIPDEGAVFQPLDKDGRPDGAPITIPFAKN